MAYIHSRIKIILCRQNLQVLCWHLHLTHSLDKHQSTSSGVGSGGRSNEVTFPQSLDNIVQRYRPSTTQRKSSLHIMLPVSDVRSSLDEPNVRNVRHEWKSVEYCMNCIPFTHFCLSVRRIFPLDSAPAESSRCDWSILWSSCEHQRHQKEKHFLRNVFITSPFSFDFHMQPSICAGFHGALSISCETEIKKTDRRLYRTGAVTL